MKYAQKSSTVKPSKILNILKKNVKIKDVAKVKAARRGNLPTDFSS